MSFESIARLDGRVAVIAGGTGTIGMATARRLIQLGATVVLLARRSEQQFAEVLAKLPGSGHYGVYASITDSSSLRSAAKAVSVCSGRCDILVNSAGFTKPVPAADLEGLSDELIDEVMSVNFRGVFATIRAFAPLLKATGDAVIVNVSSVAGITGRGNNLAYVASKAAIDLVSNSLAKVLAPEVRIMTVSPGVVDTSFVPGRGPDFNTQAAATIPLKRIGTPEDVAVAIEACITQLRFATGSRVVVDGGYHLR